MSKEQSLRELTVDELNMVAGGRIGTVAEGALDIQQGFALIAFGRKNQGLAMILEGQSDIAGLS